MSDIQVPERFRVAKRQSERGEYSVWDVFDGERLVLEAALTRPTLVVGKYRPWDKEPNAVYAVWPSRYTDSPDNKVVIGWVE